MIIYCIENLINHKKYIGYSTYYNSEEELQKSKMWGHGTLLPKAFAKYGKENFRRWVLLKNIFNQYDLANHYEVLWIKKMKSHISEWGYNKTKGGDGVHDYIFTKEHKKLISIFQINRWKNPKEHELQSKRLMGRKLANEHVKNIKYAVTKCWEDNNYRKKHIESRIGLTRTQMQKDNISSGIKKSIKKEIICIVCKNKFIRTGTHQMKCSSCKSKGGKCYYEKRVS
jgi:hypothetical protein